MEIEREMREVFLDSSARDREETVRRLRKLAAFYDSAFGIPGTSLRVGWDSIFGLIPIVGDLIGLAPLVYYLQVARRYRLGWGLHLHLVFNQILDFVFGSIPVVGDLFDWAFRANVKNAEILIRNISKGD